MTPDEPYSFGSLWHQYRRCRANKRNSLQQLAFEVDAEAQLLALQAELREHSYRPGTSICFVTEGPKPREVFAADFRDRVVHHLLVSQQERVFEPRFIHDSYACRRGKGTLAAIDRLASLLRKVTANGRRPAWALGLDVASFFPSIDKQILFEILSTKLPDPELRWLTQVLLFHDPTRDYRFRSLYRGAPRPGESGYPVAAEKSLFGKGNRCGLPIGNLTSQFWGNVYLDVLDQFIKRTLRCRFYLRYVDDMVLLSESREQLIGWRSEIADFLGDRLRLRLREQDKEIVPARNGVTFVGWKSWWSHRVPRRRTLGRLTNRLEQAERRMLRPAFSGLASRVALPRRLAPPAPGLPSPSRRQWNARTLQQTLASYAGHLRHGGSWRAWQGVLARFGWLEFVFELDGWQAKCRWGPDAVGVAPRFGAAYRCCVRRAGARCLVFWPVGRFIEFYGPQRLLAERVLRLRRTGLPRGGYAFAVGFPRQLVPHYAVRTLRAGFAVALMRSPVAAGLWPSGPGALLIPSAPECAAHAMTESTGGLWCAGEQ